MKRRKMLLVLSVVVMTIFAGHMYAIAATAKNHENLTISAGGGHAMVIREDGSLWAWGINGNGQLGDGQGGDLWHFESLPIRVMDDVIGISAGGAHSLAITGDGSLWAWGWNIFGQVGDGTMVDSFMPTMVLDDVVKASAGDMHSLALRRDGSLWAWGSGLYGRVGYTADEAILNPTKIMDNVVYISAGHFHSMAIRDDGSLWAWGGNGFGQLGDGTLDDRREPVYIMSNVISVSAGENHSLAIQEDGSLWVWGSNEFGQFGDGTHSYFDEFYPYPTRVMENVAAVSAGRFHTIAILADGSVWSWGSNNHGELGIGMEAVFWTFEPAPTKVMDNAASIAAGSGFSLALNPKGEVWGWGFNEFGQLGDGVLEDQVTPVSIIDRTLLPGADRGEAIYAPGTGNYVFIIIGASIFLLLAVMAVVFHLKYSKRVWSFFCRARK